MIKDLKTVIIGCSTITILFIIGFGGATIFAYIEEGKCDDSRTYAGKVVDFEASAGGFKTSSMATVKLDTGKKVVITSMVRTLETGTKIYGYDCRLYGTYYKPY